MKDKTKNDRSHEEDLDSVNQDEASFVLTSLPETSLCTRTTNENSGHGPYSCTCSLGLPTPTGGLKTKGPFTLSVSDGSNVSGHR